MTVDTKRLRELLADLEKFDDALADQCGTGWDFVRDGDMCKAVIEVTNLPSLLDEVERLRAENEAHTKWVQSAEQNFHSLEGKIDRLKGLIYLHGLVPRGKTVDAGKWEEIQKILGEG